MEFKGTKGELELKFVSEICIGIGTIGKYSQITANTILPETDEEYEKEREEIEANMKIYACAPEMFEALKEMIAFSEYHGYTSSTEINKARSVLEKATVI